IQTKPTAGLGYMLESGIASRGSRFGMSNRSFTPFDALNNQTYFIEIYNTGLAPLNYTISSKNDWIKLSEQKGSVQFEERVYVSIDWTKVPKEQQEGEVVLSGGGRDFTIKVPLRTEVPAAASGFIENRGIVSIDAVNFHNAVQSDKVSW